MEELKASWILEFVLRQPVEDWLAKLLLLRLPISNTLDPHLKKVLLLRRLSSDLSNSSGVSGETLAFLELLEELDRSVGAVETWEALAVAYCAVAADLTAAPLRSGRQANFFDCVNRIWNCRVADLESSEARGLMGEELRLWRIRIEEAAVSDTAKEWVLRRDTAGEAVRALREYLRVALDKLGPPLLERVASRGNCKAGATESRRFPENDDERLPSAMENRESGAMEYADTRPRHTAMQPSVNHSRRAEAATVEKATTELDEDEIESPSSDGSETSERRTMLPSPMKRKVSGPEMHKFARRRKVRRWTPLEEDALREAVKKHGSGNWKLILNCCSGDFKDRTEVDLKDKWRNMTRYKV